MAKYSRRYQIRVLEPDIGRFASTQGLSIPESRIYGDRQRVSSNFYCSAGVCCWPTPSVTDTWLARKLSSHKLAGTTKRSGLSAARGKPTAGGSAASRMKMTRCRSRGGKWRDVRSDCMLVWPGQAQ